MTSRTRTGGDPPAPVATTTDTDPAAVPPVAYGCSHGGTLDLPSGSMRASLPTLGGGHAVVRICWACRWAQMRTRGGEAA